MKQQTQRIRVATPTVADEKLSTRNDRFATGWSLDQSCRWIHKLGFPKTRLQISFTVPVGEGGGGRRRRGTRGLIVSRDYLYFPSMKSYLYDRERANEARVEEGGREMRHREIGGGPRSEIQGLGGFQFLWARATCRKNASRPTRFSEKKRPLCLPSLSRRIPCPRSFPLRLLPQNVTTMTVVTLWNRRFDKEPRSSFCSIETFFLWRWMEAFFRTNSSFCKRFSLFAVKFLSEMRKLKRFKATL